MDNKCSICFNCKKYGPNAAIDGCGYDDFDENMDVKENPGQIRYPSLDPEFRICVGYDPIATKTYEDIQKENQSEINFIEKNKDNDEQMNNFVPHVDEIETPDRPKKPSKPITEEEYQAWKDSIIERMANRDQLYIQAYGMTQKEFEKQLRKPYNDQIDERPIESNEDMLKGNTEVSHFEQITTWKRALNAARRTIGKESLDKEPSKSWEAKMLLAEHSPIRLVEYDFGWRKIRQWVTTHLVRHHEGCEKFVHSQRGDRRELPCDRDHIYQGAKNDMDMTCNAQAMINISRKRLCSCASNETHKAWKQVIDELEKIDPVLRSKCVPECIYRGFCPEFMNSCGYYKTEQFKKDLAKYRSTKFGKDIKYYCVVLDEDKQQKIVVSNTGHIYEILSHQELYKEGILNENVNECTNSFKECKYEINKSINGDELCITHPIIPVSSLVVACFSEVPYYSNIRKIEGKIRSTYNKIEIIKHIDGNIYNNDIDNLITNCENII